MSLGDLASDIVQDLSSEIACLKSERLEFKKFSKSPGASYAWCGAEHFKGTNHEPLIAEMKIDGKDATVILSGNPNGMGELLEIHTFEPDISWVPAYMQFGLIVTQLKPEMTKEELAKLAIFPTYI